MNLLFESHPGAPPAVKNQQVIFVPRGISSKQQLFSELTKSGLLPSYFGSNWDSLDELLSDLDWLPGKTLLIVHSDVPLNTVPEEQQIYLQILNGACDKVRVVFPSEYKNTLTTLLR